MDSGTHFVAACAATRRLRIATFGCIAGLALLILLVCPPWASAEPVSKHIAKAPATVKSSWGTADFLAAEPAPGSVSPAASFDLPDYPAASASASSGDFAVADPSAYPNRLQGKVFFRIGDTAYQCSGTLVSSRRGNLIYTAGHCVFDQGTADFVQDLVFVPGYLKGETPFGFFAATNLITTRGWAQDGSYSYDIAVATLAGEPTADLGPGRKLAFDLKPVGRKYTIYGYPADPEPRYDGEGLIGCHSTVVGRDKGNPSPLTANPCFMGHGASGGGWITGGYLNSVTSYFYCDIEPSTCGYLFGPYFSDAAKMLYTGKTAGGSVKPKARFLYKPPHRVRKRKVLFRFTAEASTPVEYECRLDGRRFESCGARTTVSRLSPGRHILRVRTTDQTGKRAPGLLKRSFRVISR